MTQLESEKNERDFSIELDSNRHLTRFSTSTNGNGSGVLIEGTLGKLQHAFFVEPEIFEIKGNYGILRLNLTSNEIKDQSNKPGGEEI
jgi:hypothetical protein